MKVLIQRDIILANDKTLGSLWVEGKLFCYTVEDPVRRNQPKVAGDTAIPAGTYPLSIQHSPRFKRLMPTISDVPNFTGIRIHTGNTKKDSEGCPIIGFVRTLNGVGESRLAFDAFYKVLLAARNRKEKCTIEIKDLV